VDRVCPLLGLQGDRRSAIDGVDAGHRCHADEPPLPLDRQQQARVCLTVAHERCDRYLAHATRNGGLRPARSGMVDGLVSTRMVLAPDPAWRGIAGRARRASTGPLLAVGVAGLALGIGGVVVASGVVDGLGGPAGGASSAVPPSPTPTPSPSPTPTATPSPSPTPTPTQSPSPTPAATPQPTSAPTAAPPPPPPPQQTYVVQEGDTLAAIAQRFGTSVSALQSANGIEDPDEIIIGQVLVIP
jgi:LysM repeat protein